MRCLVALGVEETEGGGRLKIQISKVEPIKATCSNGRQQLSTGGAAGAALCCRPSFGRRTGGRDPRMRIVLKDCAWERCDDALVIVCDPGKQIELDDPDGHAERLLAALAAG